MSEWHFYNVEYSDFTLDNYSQSIYKRHMSMFYQIEIIPVVVRKGKATMTYWHHILYS